MAPGSMNDMLIKNCNFTKKCQTPDCCALDSEAEWDMCKMLPLKIIILLIIPIITSYVVLVIILSSMDKLIIKYMFRRELEAYVYSIIQI